MSTQPRVKYHGHGDYESEDSACCRGCGKVLRGKPYYMGGIAYLPLEEGGGQAKTCLYGGFVCSRSCDVKACLALEQSMPGHGISQKQVLPETKRNIDAKWGDQ
jgi:hypothetical protein